MNISEFKKQPDEYSFDVWHWKDAVATPLGKATVEFQIENRKEPDDEMLQRAAELVQYAQAHGDHILDIVHGSYLSVSKTDPDYLKLCGVPADLAREKMEDYLEREPFLVVTRDDNEDEPYNSSVFVVPLWDEEHALTLKFQDGAVVSVNDSPFKIEKGVLKLLDEE